jgi:hypothetical protein
MMMLTVTEQRQLIKQELEKRETIKQLFQLYAEQLLTLALPKQLEIINHPAKRKAFCAPRRTGKSYLIGLLLVLTALQFPNSKTLYLGLTNKSAKNIIWNDILRDILVKLNLNKYIKFLRSDLEIQFPNGAIIYVAGADATPDQKEKLRGNKYRLAVIDECQSYHTDIRELASQILGPALRELQGTLIMLGTAGNNTSENNYWFRTAGPQRLEPEFEVFTDTWQNNTSIEPVSGKRICDLIQQDIDQELAKNPKMAKAPWFRQEYLNEWCIDEGMLIYRLHDYNQIYEQEIPPGFFSRFTRYLLGVDFGHFPDPCAFVVAAFNPEIDNVLYIIESYQQLRMNVTECATQIKVFKEKYQPEVIVVDGANTQIVEEIAKVHRLPLITAEKTKKAAFQQMMNSDFQTDNIKIVMPANQHMVKQLNELIWDEKLFRAHGTRKEVQNIHNDYCDALLYLHRYSRHLFYRPKLKSTYHDQYIDDLNKWNNKFNNKKRDLDGIND